MDGDDETETGTSMIVVVAETTISEMAMRMLMTKFLRDRRAARSVFAFRCLSAQTVFEKVESPPHRPHQPCDIPLPHPVPHSISSPLLHPPSELHNCTHFLPITACHLSPPAPPPPSLLRLLGSPLDKLLFTLSKPLSFTHTHTHTGAHSQTLLPPSEPLHSSFIFCLC